MTTLENQLQKIQQNPKNGFKNENGVIITTPQVVEISNLRLKVERYLGKKLFNIKHDLIKDEIINTKSGEKVKKALFKVLGKQNHSLATSINQILQGFKYEIFKTYKTDKEGKIVKNIISILVDEDGYKKGVEFFIQ